VQSKTLMIGLLAAVACLWLLLTWEPVSREAPELSTADTEAPEAAPAPPPSAALPPPLPSNQEPAVAQAPSPAAAHEEPAPPAAAPTEPDNADPLRHGSIPLVPADPRELNVADIPPPSASGPLEQLQKQFESGSRDAASTAMEQSVQEAFKLTGVAPELLESAVCQGEICRVRTRWTPERASGFTVAFSTLALNLPGVDGTSAMFEKNFALGPASDRNSNGERTIDVYLRKR
jgi:hypothetical protein